ncbi:DUF4838 domain-containing protein [candidate division KSB1 bacterium]|nr:DUF4838 domain-containing protein [candidate division KSB1 bacterium]
MAKQSGIIIAGIFLLLIMNGSTVFGEAAVVKFEMNQWLRTWLLCGPFRLDAVPESAADYVHLPGFETDFLKAHGGEAVPEIREGQVETFKGESVTWFKYTSDDSVVSLDDAVSTEEFVAAYAYCEIESPKDQVCLLAFGTNDGGRLWVNGERLWDYSEGRGLRPDDDSMPVLLRKGKNTLLLKVEERGNIWAFCARFLPFEPAQFVAQSRLFYVANDDEGRVSLRFLLAESVISKLFKDVKLQVFDVEQPQMPSWEENWTKKPKMALGIDPHKYAKYILKMEARLMDNSVHKIELPFAGGKRIEYELFKDGKTDYVIVLGEQASESEQWAAKELKHWLSEVSGADFPIVSDAKPVSQREIVVGFNKRAKALLGEKFQAPAKNDESFTYLNVGQAIVIWGGAARGTMYGVMDFLEREMGCRWYTPNVSVIPEKPAYTFDLLYHSESPGIRVRNDFYYEAFEPIWAARNKINGAMNYREQPGGVEGYWAVHTFYRFMPPEEFFADHPEYYSEINGKRVHERAQLCLTNPDVLRIVTERLRQTMHEFPEYLIYSVSQNDWSNPCQCAKCQAIAEREGGEAGPLIWFVNQVAENIESEFPDKFVGTLAYTYTRKPCRTLKPRHNVVIRLCSIECCFAHDFHHCPENESFISDLQGWSAIAPHLYIWDYVVNFGHYIMPYPNFRVLQPNIKTFRDNHAIGIMEQAAYQSRGGEFSELRAYLISKLLWNPECDVTKVFDDFMYGYYGRSGQHICRYFDLLHNRLTPETHIHLGLKPEDKLFTDDFIREADAIFDAAETVADNEEIRQRVEVARLPIMYLKCKRAPVEAKFDGTYQRFCQIVKREGITHYAEAGIPHVEAFHNKVEAAK